MTAPTIDITSLIAELRERAGSDPVFPTECLFAKAADALEASQAREAELREQVDDETRDYDGGYEAGAGDAQNKIDEADARIRQLEAAIGWALGEGDSDFGDNKPENAKPFWWRAELRARTAFARTALQEKTNDR